MARFDGVKNSQVKMKSLEVKTAFGISVVKIVSTFSVGTDAIILASVRNEIVNFILSNA